MAQQTDIDQFDRKPLYRHIADQLQIRVRRGELKPGEALPSERKLSEMYEVSTMTVRQALDALRQEGLVRTRRGAGTFVCAANELKSPANATTQRLGLIACDDVFTGRFYFHLLRGLDDAVQETRSQISYLLYDRFNDNWDGLKRRLEQEHFDAMLLTGSHACQQLLLEGLGALKIPVVVIGNYDLPPGTHNVAGDFVGAAAEGTRLLASRGHERFALLHSGRRKLHLNRHLGIGFQKGLASCELRSEAGVEFEQPESDGYRALEEVMRGESPPTGVLLTESFSPGAIRWLNEHPERARGVECVNVTTDPMLDHGAFEPWFGGHLVLHVDHLGREAGRLACQILDRPDIPVSRQVIPFSLLTCSPAEASTFE